MERTIHREEIPSTDKRLSRHINHDPESKKFAFNTAGLSIVDVTHQRYVPVFDQGQVGSCTGNAGVGSISTDPFVNADNSVYSRNESGALKLYSDAQVLDGNGAYPPNDNGSSGLTIAKVLKSKGLISGYQHTFTLDDALMAGSQYAFITGVNWYENMFNPDSDGRVHPTGKLAGGHEFELSQIDVKNQRVWFFNSWGTNWGVKGRFYMTWTDYSLLLSQQGDVTVLIPSSVTPPTPNPTPYYFASPMSYSSVVNPEVVQLQNYLKTIGFFPQDVSSTGKFLTETAKAVIKFQVSKGIMDFAKETNMKNVRVGTKTLQALNAGYPMGLMSALIQVESGGNDNAIGDVTLLDKAYGCLQIRQGVVDSINAVLGTQYKAQDCLGNRNLSILIFTTYFSKCHPEMVTDQDKAFTWNGGAGWKSEYGKPGYQTYTNALNTYWKKVSAVINSIVTN